MFKTTLVTTLVMAAVVGTGSPAYASPDPSTSTYSQSVRVSDLDASSEAGARALLHRIRVTAARVCSRAAGRVSTDSLLWTSRSYRDCVHGATSRAVATVDKPMVTALYNGSPQIQVAGY